MEGSSVQIGSTNSADLKQTSGRVELHHINLSPTQVQTIYGIQSAESRVLLLEGESVRFLTAVPNDGEEINHRDNECTITSTRLESTSSAAKPTKKSQEEATFPKPPKPPSTAYTLYLREQRSVVRDANPTLSFPQITSIIGKNWTNLSIAAKKSYKSKALAESGRYKSEYKRYQLSLNARQGIPHGSATAILDADIKSAEGAGLFCSMCNLFFVNSHNKEQHLLGQSHRKRLSAHFRPPHPTKKARTVPPPICDPFDAEALQLRIQDIVEDRRTERSSLKAKRSELTERLKFPTEDLDNAKERMKGLERAKNDLIREKAFLQQQLTSLTAVSLLFESDQYLNSI